MDIIDHNSKEEVEKRANQEDPIVMYLIVRESLEMSVGKTAAQCAHAAQMIMLNYYNYKEEVEGCENCGWEVKYDYGFEANSYKTMQDWLQGSFRKVVLVANEKEWEKVLAENISKIVVKDAGLTELEPGTDTVIGLYPIRKSERSKIIKRLQTLK